MTELASKRKKYVREVTPTWWKKSHFYTMYMVREATAIPTIWFCLVLLYGVICLGRENGIVESFIPFLHNPIVMLLNLISLVALLYHAKTLFVMTPEALNIVVNNERLNPKVITNALWAITAVVSVIALILAFL